MPNQNDVFLEIVRILNIISKKFEEIKMITSKYPSDNKDFSNNTEKLHDQISRFFINSFEFAN